MIGIQWVVISPTYEWLVVFHQPNLKNMHVKLGSSSPRFRGENKKCHLSCHHLVMNGGMLRL